MPQPLAPVDLGSSVASNAATSGIRRPSLAGPAPPPFAPCPPSLSLFLLAPTIASSGSPSRAGLAPPPLAPYPPSLSFSVAFSDDRIDELAGWPCTTIFCSQHPSLYLSIACSTDRKRRRRQKNLSITKSCELLASLVPYVCFQRSSAKRQTVEMKLLPSKRSGGTKRSGSASVHDEAIAIQQLMRGTCIRGEVRWESVKEQIY
ncbi:RNA-dependent RNA polymerase [Musa troglodytarum]|uniref:RNA-dependent RNA polymerase n=1 Tax=Musa troglodytarum TaxID=320322 RepID=A0A9E7IHI9_9LILI|nr:RNA-dependent RNA polymerase [Musa troglodytarum]